MTALLVEEYETEEQPDEAPQSPRLYSKGYSTRGVVSHLAERHAEIDALLIRWGAWSRARHARRSLGSVEALYRKVAGSRATAPALPDVELLLLDRAITRMPEDHRKTLIRLYIYGLMPTTICGMLRMRYESWPAWIDSCRAMASNLLRRVKSSRIVAPNNSTLNAHSRAD